MRTITFILIAIVALGGLSACKQTVTPPVNPTAMSTATAPPAPPVTATLLSPSSSEVTLNTPTPLAISTQDCLLTEIPLLNERLWLLESFAWSPRGDRLAYIGPNSDKADISLTGTLILSIVPHSDTPQILASNAIGDPTWSPDGSQIAFVAFRPSDQLGTIMIVNADGSNLTDTLPENAAHTDSGAGYKAIEGWWDKDQIVVSTNCGAGCRRLMLLDLRQQALEPILPSGQEGNSYVWSPDRASIVVTNGANPQIGVISQNEEEVSWFSGHGSLDIAQTSSWTFFFGLVSRQFSPSFLASTKRQIEVAGIVDVGQGDTNNVRVVVQCYRGALVTPRRSNSISGTRATTVGFYREF